MSSSHSLGGLIKWIGREPLRSAMAEVLDDHFAPAAASAGLTVEELTERLGELGYMAIWGVAFEDFVSRQLDEGGAVAHRYLKRRGWKESASTRAYLEALGRSSLSLYMVSEVVPGQGFVLTDLVRGGPPALIVERSASRSLGDGDIVGARVIALKASRVITGGVLAFAPRAAAKLLAGIAKLAGKVPDDVETAARLHNAGFDRAALDPALATDLALAHAPALFSTIWLQETLAAMANPALPPLFNSDGEPFELQSIRYPIAKGVRLATVRGRLNARVNDLWAESDSYWNWLGGAPEAGGAAALPREALQLTTTMEEGGVVLGNLKLEGRTLTLSVNSRARAARGQALIASSVGELVGTPEVETHALDDLAGHGHGGPPAPGASGLAPAEELRIVHRALTQHYRQQLDQPVPALGQHTPRVLAASAAGRDEVADWLRYLERSSARTGDAVMAAYDFAWMWDELGLADLRC